jgi:hypothetical protein
MNTHTTIQGSKLMSNSYIATKNKLFCVIEDRIFYDFKAGDILSVVGIIKYPDEEVDTLLISVNNTFAFEELSMADFPEFVDLSKCIEPRGTSATAVSQPHDFKIVH